MVSQNEAVQAKLVRKVPGITQSGTRAGLGMGSLAPRTKHTFLIGARASMKPPNLEPSRRVMVIDTG